MRRLRQLRTLWQRAFVPAVLVLGLSACKGIVTPPPLPPSPTPAAGSSMGLATPTIAPEIYLTPIPPTPTFTPSPTPTPVIHIVEQGDTLFGVAIEYGVTVDGLLLVNGLSEDDYLHIGQALIIPLELEDSTDELGMQAPASNVILPTPTPLPLDTAGVALYQTPVGGLWCMGEVVNTTGGPVTDMQVEAVLQGPDGTRLLTAVTLAAADYLAPGQRAPFSVLFRDPPAGASDVSVSLLRGEAVSPITAGFVPLKILDTEGAVSGPQYRVRGIVANESDATLSRISVVATIYNKEGYVVGYRQFVMSGDVALAPGQQQSFEILLTPQEVAPPTDFSVIAWAVTG